MGRISKCSSKDGFKRGAWTCIEDKMLTDYVTVNGEGRWNRVARTTDLKRSGKSCRLRWLNYLRPGIKRGNISEDEEQLIARLHKLLGNRWSLIAGRLPGRTDNEIKNYWHSTLAKKIQPFELPISKVNIRKQPLDTPTHSTPESTSASSSRSDRNHEVVKPTVPESEDSEINPNYLNVEDFPPIFYEAVHNCNEGKEDDKKYWDEYFINFGEQFDNQFINGSDFISIDSFLDFDQVLGWSELA